MVHRQTQNGQERELQWADAPSAATEYMVVFLRMVGSKEWKVKGCRGGATSKANLWVIFLHWNVQDTIVILKEVNPDCNMFVPWMALKRWNSGTNLCAPGG